MELRLFKPTKNDRIKLEDKRVKISSKAFFSALFFLTLLVFFLAIALRHHHESASATAARMRALIEEHHLAQATTPLPEVLPPVTTKTILVSIRQNDSLPRVFKRNNLDPKDAKTILTLAQARDLTTLRPGKKIELSVDTNTKKIQAINYAVDDLTTVTVGNNNGFYAHTVHVEPKLQVEYASAAINGSIYNSGAKAGVPRKVIAQLVSVFSNKINFNKVHNGDKFAVFYKEYLLNGKKYRDGEVAAAEFTHNNSEYRVVGFADEKNDVK